VITRRLQRLARGISSRRNGSPQVAGEAGIAARGKPNSLDEAGRLKVAKRVLGLCSV
jgi:hypothetical protein